MIKTHQIKMFCAQLTALFFYLLLFQYTAFPSPQQPADLRCTARGNATPDSKVAWRGFRVAMAIEERA